MQNKYDNKYCHILNTTTLVVNPGEWQHNGLMHDSIDDLLNESRVFYHALVNIGEKLHSEEDLSLGMRAVLETLSGDGPQTVPEMAKARRVTRQRVQALVDALKARGYVTARANPAHKRSVVIALTDPGAEVIARMKQRERQYISERLEVGKNTPTSAGQITSALKTLRTLRAHLERGL